MIVAAVICATVLGVLWRVEGVLRQAAEARRQLQERELALRERELALLEQRQAASLEPDEMPVDLMMRCAAETEDWAREQLRSLVQQLYSKHKNWDSVRTELMKLDMIASNADAGWSLTRVTT